MILSKAQAANVNAQLATTNVVENVANVDWFGPLRVVKMASGHVIIKAAIRVVEFYETQDAFKISYKL